MATMGIRKEHRAWLNTLTLKERLLYDRTFGECYFDPKWHDRRFALAKKAVLDAQRSKDKP